MLTVLLLPLRQPGGNLLVGRDGAGGPPARKIGLEFVEFGGSASNFSNHPVEDAVTMHFKTARGAVGTASWNFAGATKEDQITIDATAGRIVLSTFGSDLLIETRNGTRALDIAPPEHVQQPLIQSIVDELRGRGSCAPAQVRSGSLRP